MDIKNQASKKKNWLNGVSGRTPAMIGALTLGAGLFSGATADASVMITDFDLTITSGNYSGFDLDGNGSFDISIFVSNYIPSDINAFNGLSASFPKYKGAGKNTTTMFSEGETVDSGNVFNNSSYLSYLDDFYGEWVTVGAHGYIGIQFDISGDTHYGWLEVERGSAIVTRGGYETQAGVGAFIPARTSPIPEPGTLTLLAAGAIGMAGIHRRRQKSIS